MSAFLVGPPNTEFGPRRCHRVGPLIIALCSALTAPGLAQALASSPACHDSRIGDGVPREPHPMREPGVTRGIQPNLT